MTYAPHFCDVCQAWAPPRTNHCSLCERCVLRLDHHCKLAGNCIGLNNHGNYLLSVAFAVLGLYYSLGLCVATFVPWVIYMVKQRLPEFVIEKVGGPASVEPEVDQTLVLHAAMSLLAFTWAGGLGYPAWFNAMRGMTLLEEAERGRIEYVEIAPETFVPLKPNFYRHGIRENLLELLGPRWKLRLVLPISGGPIDPNVVLSPKPGPRGILGLRWAISRLDEGHAPDKVEELGGPVISPSGPAQPLDSFEDLVPGAAARPS